MSTSPVGALDPSKRVGRGRQPGGLSSVRALLLEIFTAALLLFSAFGVILCAVFSRAAQGLVSTEAACEEMERQLRSAAPAAGIRGAIRVAAGLEIDSPSKDAALESFRKKAVDRWTLIPGWTVLREEDIKRMQSRVASLPSSIDPDKLRLLLEKAYEPAWDWLAVCRGEKDSLKARLRCRFIDYSSVTRLEVEAVATNPERYEKALERSIQARQALPWLATAAAASAAVLFLIYFLPASKRSP